MSDEHVLSLAVRVHGREYHVIGREPMHGGALALITNDKGTIISFTTADDARRYIAAHHPPADEYAMALAELLGHDETPAIDLDATLRWCDHPVAGEGDPRDLVFAWELLSAADCAPPMPPFDPMGMIGLEDPLIIAGMKLSGMHSHAQRKGMRPGPAAWDAVGDYWTETDGAAVAKVFRSGISELSAKLV